MRGMMLAMMVVLAVGCGTEAPESLVEVNTGDPPITGPLLVGQIGERNFDGEAELSVLRTFENEVFSTHLTQIGEEGRGLLVIGSQRNLLDFDEGQYSFTYPNTEVEGDQISVLVCAGPNDPYTSTDYDQPSDQTSLTVVGSETGMHFEFLTSTQDHDDPDGPVDTVQASFDLNFEPESI